MCRSKFETIRSGLPNSNNDNKSFDAVEQKFGESKRVETWTLMNSLTTVKYNENG